MLFLFKTRFDGGDFGVSGLLGYDDLFVQGFPALSKCRFCKLKSIAKIFYSMLDDIQFFFLLFFPSFVQIVDFNIQFLDGFIALITTQTYFLNSCVQSLCFSVGFADNGIFLCLTFIYRFVNLFINFLFPLAGLVLSTFKDFRS